jgi:hypothetical protein
MSEPRRKRLTWRRADRALSALVDLMECEDTAPLEFRDLDRAADAVRAIRDRLPKRSSQ